MIKIASVHIAMKSMMAAGAGGEAQEMNLLPDHCCQIPGQGLGCKWLTLLEYSPGG